MCTINNTHAQTLNVTDTEYVSILLRIWQTLWEYDRHWRCEQTFENACLRVFARGHHVGVCHASLCRLVVCAYVCVCVRVHVCTMYACMYVCLYVCMNACMCVCVCMCVCMHNAYVYTHTYTHTHTYTCTTYTYTYTYMYTSCIDTYIINAKWCLSS